MVLGLLELGGSGHRGATPGLAGCSLGVASATPPPDISSWPDGSTGPAGFLQVLPHAHPALLIILPNVGVVACFPVRSRAPLWVLWVSWGLFVVYLGSSYTEVSSWKKLA